MVQAATCGVGEAKRVEKAITVAVAVAFAMAMRMIMHVHHVVHGRVILIEEGAEDCMIENGWLKTKTMQRDRFRTSKGPGNKAAINEHPNISLTVILVPRVSGILSKDCCCLAEGQQSEEGDAAARHLRSRGGERGSRKVETGNVRSNDGGEGGVQCVRWLECSAGEQACGAVHKCVKVASNTNNLRRE